MRYFKSTNFEIKNKGVNNPVTTADFEVVNTETGTTEETLDFFPPNRLTGENILIVKLKPNPGGKGEKVHLEGTAVIGNGAMNARFSPTSAVMYVNQIDPTKVEAAVMVATPAGPEPSRSRPDPIWEEGIQSGGKSIHADDQRLFMAATGKYA